MSRASAWNVMDESLNDLKEFWRVFMNRDSDTSEIEAEFDCVDECMYRCMCEKKERKKTIGRWCPHYVEQFVESMNKDEGKKKEADA